MNDQSNKREAVVLLHGLARTKASMSSLENYLCRQGFMVVNQGYPSRTKTIEVLSENIIPAALETCKKLGAKKIHFITHSMGGIMVRYFLENHTIPTLGRVVMLSPPNQGSEVVDKSKCFILFKWLNGPAGQQLGTKEHSIPNQLGSPYYEVGIITGDRSINPVLSWLIPGKNDGKVSVERAKLNGMKDFLVVQKTHPFIMNDSGVHQQACAFILKGEFNHE